MGRFHQLISTCLGIGYTPKGGGTVAALVCCIAWYFAWTGGNVHFWGQLIVTLLLLVVGIWSAGKVEDKWGKDPSRVVIDEAAGMCLGLLWVPVHWQYILIGLLLFRYFDIAKPLYIRKMEQLKGGWGIMMDDMLAGLYTNLLLQIIVLFRPW
ncbi:MAG TPA: phosphatidylglycerophosphatase A [Puia sp.]|jgi:phosphatidylglycerophosphatase A|nr:phosphatidylglycerophosphatase A [Puia sp.]